MSANKYNLAMKASTANETLMELATDSDDAVRLAVARNPSSKEAVLQVLALDKNTDVRNSVLTHHAAPEGLVLSMLSEASLVSKCSLAQRKELTPQIYAALFADASEKVLSRLGRNESAPEHILRQLGAHLSDNVRKAVATNPCCPLDLLLELSRDPKPEVVGRSASNSSMPSYRLDELARESGPKTDAKKIYVAGNRSADASTLVWLLELNESYVSILSEVVKNPSLPFVDKLRVAFLGLNDAISGDLKTWIRAKPGEFWRGLATEGNLRLQDEISYSGRKAIFGEALIEAGMIEAYQTILSIELERGISAAGMGHKQICDHRASGVRKKMM